MKLIQSRDNPFYKGLKRLAESGRERRKTGRTLLDGLHLVEGCEKACGPVETLIVAESAPAGGEIAAYVAGRETIVLADALLRDLGLVDTPSGLLAVAAMPAATVAVDREKDAILLDGVQDPGNVGAILRTAAAAGVGQALLSPGCAAAWSPKVLRAGQATGQHDQVEGLGQNVDQHGIGGQSRATGTGDHPSAFDTGHHHLNLGPPQYINQGYAFEVFNTIGNADKSPCSHRFAPCSGRA